MLSTIIRDNIKKLAPYSSARSEYQGNAAIMLDANENAYGADPAFNYHRYPDPLQRQLKRRLAQLKEVSEAQIFLGNGSDEAIDLLIRICCEPGRDNILVMPPTYGMYAVSAKINNVRIKEVPLKEDFRMDVAAVLDAVDQLTKVLFICSPNNPSGNLLDLPDIARIVRSFKGLVVIDEAYIDFSGSSSVYKILGGYSNVVVLQTLSKAWSMAGLRLGMAFADPELIDLMNKVKPPYNISAPVQELALNALAQEEKVHQWVSAIVADREWLATALAAIPVVQKVYPSDANFLLLRVRDAKGLYNFLIRQGIIVRDRSNIPQCENCIRITIGTKEENTKLLTAIAAYS